MRKWLFTGAAIKQRKDYELDRVFFIDMIARRLLFWSCIHQFRTLYAQEMTIYAKLPDINKVAIDDLSGVHFGNIDMEDQ